MFFSHSASVANTQLSKQSRLRRASAGHSPGGCNSRNLYHQQQQQHQKQQQQLQQYANRASRRSYHDSIESASLQQEQYYENQTAQDNKNKNNTQTGTTSLNYDHYELHYLTHRQAINKHPQQVNEEMLSKELGKRIDLCMFQDKTRKMEKNNDKNIGEMRKNSSNHDETQDVRANKRLESSATNESGLSNSQASNSKATLGGQQSGSSARLKTRDMSYADDGIR